MPWPFKIIIKVFLSYFPGLYPLLKKLGLSQLGQMNVAAYARRIFEIHTQRSYPQGMPANLCILELGPGDSLAGALWGAHHQTQRTYLVDVGSFANREVDLYQNMATEWRNQGLAMPDLSGCETINDVLSVCHGHYLTQGLASLRTIPSQSIDFSWSHSVLEHIRKREFLDIFRELKRITKPGSLSSHLVDLQDHLNHSLNNLRFSEKIWEAEWFARGAFYTNRIRAQEMIRLVEQAGFTVVATERGYWPALPLPRKKLDPAFRDLPDDELRTRTLSLLLRA
jgi:hypothetical protein